MKGVGKRSKHLDLTKLQRELKGRLTNLNNKFKILFSGIAIIGLLTANLVGCGTSTTTTTTTGSKTSSDSTPVSNTPGVTATSILLGSYQPMTGSESTYYRMGKGADAWYKYINDQGGINGRKINFKMVDDGYQPARTQAIVKQFIEQEKVFALANPLGSAPTAAVVDYIVANNVPIIGPGSGAAKVVRNPSKWVWPLYPDYGLEAVQLIEMIKKQYPNAKKIAYIYQNDESGQTSLAGVEENAKSANLQIVSKQGYQVSEVDISSQVIAAKKEQPDVLLVFAAPEHLSKILVERQSLGWNIPVVASFIGLDSSVFKLAGKEAVNGLLIDTIFRAPDSSEPSIAKFREILKKYYPQEEPSAIHMWGYAGAQVVTEALTRAGKDLTRDNFIAALGSINSWKGSIIPEVNLSADQRIIINKVSWMQAKDGQFVEFNAGN